MMATMRTLLGDHPHAPPFYAASVSDVIDATFCAG
jgi:hypothetical protein